MGSGCSFVCVELNPGQTVKSMDKKNILALNTVYREKKRSFRSDKKTVLRYIQLLSRLRTGKILVENSA